MSRHGDLPVGLAFAYLKGSIWLAENNPKEPRALFQLRSATRLFERAITEDRGFLSRRLEKTAIDCGWITARERK